jgi:aminopeptidase N
MNGNHQFNHIPYIRISKTKKMKKLLVALVLLPMFVFAQEKVGSCSHAKSILQAQTKSNTFSLAQIAQTERYDVHYYFLNLTMTNTSTTLSGVGEIHASARENLDSALIEFYPTMTINSIKVDGNPVNYSRIATAVTIPVNKLQGEHFVLAIDYNGTPPTAQSNPLGGGGMTNASSPSWGNQVTWSLSESFSAYEWFPVKQSLHDKADSSAVWITVPTNCKAGSNGVLEQVVELGNGTHRFEWKHRHPIDYYLISVAVAKYVEYIVTANPVGSGPVMIQNYIYDNPQTLINFQADLDETADFIELYAYQFGPYPFADEKYGHCMAPISGGMEHQTMTTQGFFNPTLTAHELAHQWFGDNVTCSSWADIWVNEGFASYAEYLMLDTLYPTQSAQDMLDRHSNIKSQPGGSVWVIDSLTDASIFSSRLVYDKGAAIIHTLRYLINNDDLFFQALKNYQIAYADSTASGLDFIQIVENTTGMDFTSFMQEWYFGQGYPIYSVRWNSVGSDLLVEINQQTSMSAATPLFTNDLTLKFDRTGMSDTLIRFSISGNQNQFIVPNGDGAIVNILSIDPENWICNGDLGITHDLSFVASIDQDQPFSDLTYYPNPTNGKVNIEMATESTYELTLLDSRGRKIDQFNFTQLTAIDLTNRANGSYIIQVKDQKSDLIVRRIIKR